MKFLVSVGLLSCLVFLIHATPHCHIQQLCDCIEIAIEWLHTLPKRSIPETEAEVEVMCTELTKALDCGFGFRDNCTTPLQKELVGLIIEGTIDLKNDFCTPGSDSRSKYLSHATCLNKVSQMDEIKDQIEYIMAVFEKAQNMIGNQFITYACCGYSKIITNIGKLGVDNCGQEAVDSLVGVLRVAIAQLPDVVCGGYDGHSQTCTDILPPDGSKPSDDVKELKIYQAVHRVLKNWLD